jgi:hypothetical protein
MKPGFYWARVKDLVHFRPVPEPVELKDSGFVYRTGMEDAYEENEMEFFGPCKPPGVRIARIQVTKHEAIDRKKLVTWRIYVPARRIMKIGDGDAWQWVVRACTYDDARAAFRQSFDIKAIPHGVTFTRI